MSPTRRTNLLLLLGLVAGAGLAAVGILRDAHTQLPTAATDAVAIVNGRAIPRTRLEQALALLERDRERPVTTQERQRALDRIVDEELLVQKAQELGIPESDRKLRADMVAAVLDAVAAQSDTEELPDERELRRFFEDNRAVLAPPAQLRVGVVFVSAERHADARERAAAAAARLRDGLPLQDVRAELGDPPALEAPDSALPPSRLADYIGPTAATLVQQMSVGDISDPIGGSDGYRVVVLLERLAPQADFQTMREQALAEYRRRQREERVRLYLDELRRQARVEVTRDVVEGAKVGLGPGR
ncbi:MAG TPA: peptidyl-prolyl cis-trans isomerase [Candidatus Limnocylindrales bacterium]|nr:peptidyl-prolyl cis-trans isomerase [Candidatus Limnocylindrales bacterium]